MAFKFFGEKKKKFYAELDESQASAPEVAPEVAPPSASAPVAAVAEEAVAQAAPNSPAPTAESSQKKSKKTSVKTKTKESTPAPATVPAPVVSKPKVEPTEVAFASKNILTPTLVRRRPGPSLNVFKAIAREISPRR
jgi:hypothetical protein